MTGDAAFTNLNAGCIKKEYSMTSVIKGEDTVPFVLLRLYLKLCPYFRIGAATWSGMRNSGLPEEPGPTSYLSKQTTSFPFSFK